MMVAIYEPPLYRSESAGRTRCLAQRAPCYAGRESDRSKPACHEQRAQPTARAEALQEAIRPVLRQIERVLEVDTSFDPASAIRAFTIRLSDLLGFLLLPELLDRLRQNAPGIALDVLHLPPAKTVDALEKDELDLAVSM